MLLISLKPVFLRCQLGFDHASVRRVLSGYVVVTGLAVQTSLIDVLLVIIYTLLFRCIIACMCVRVRVRTCVNGAPSPCRCSLEVCRAGRIAHARNWLHSGVCEWTRIAWYLVLCTCSPIWKGDPLASSLQCLDDIVPELHEKHKLEVTIIAQVSECVCLSVFESTNSVYWDWACAVRLVCYWMWLPCVPPPPSPSILAWLCSLMLCVFWRRHSRGGSSPLSQHHWKMATKTGPQRIVLVRECMYLYHAPLCII